MKISTFIGIWTQVYICLAYSLKCIHNLKMNTPGTFLVICRQVQNGENFKSLDTHVPCRGQTRQHHLLSQFSHRECQLWRRQEQFSVVQESPVLASWMGLESQLMYLLRVASSYLSEPCFLFCKIKKIQSTQMNCLSDLILYNLSYIDRDRYFGDNDLVLTNWVFIMTL